MRNPETAMRPIIRCPTCFTYVYADARDCHGCGQRLGRRRWLTRGSWVFITLVVAGFAIARSIDLHQEKRDRQRRQFDTALEIEHTSAFVKQWLTAPAGALEVTGPGDADFAAELEKIRARFPAVLPASDIERIQIRESGWERHRQKTGEAIVHTDGSRRLRASRVPGSRRSVTSTAARHPTHYWTSHEYLFEATVRRDGSDYTVKGSVCIDDRDDAVICLELHGIEGIEGEVEPKE
jgi:hypothetical protein